MKGLFYLLVVIALCLLLGSCIRWRWNECRQVGHGAAYCLFADLGRN